MVFEGCWIGLYYIEFGFVIVVVVVFCYICFFEYFVGILYFEFYVVFVEKMDCFVCVFRDMWREYLFG